VPVVCKKNLFTISRNLALFVTSWYEYLSFPTQPSSSGPTCTPTGMRSRTIFVVGFLRGELGICILSLCVCGWLEVPTTYVFSFVSHYDQAETSSVFSPNGCSEMVI
jgi:hypothetical protein